MFRRKSLAFGAAALLASAAAVQPVAAQYYGGDPYYERYQQQQSQYERDRQYYDQQYRQQYGNQYQAPAPYAGQQYQQPYQQPYAQGYYGQQQQYGYDQRYSLTDDPYWRECRQQRQGNQIAGLIIGGLVGAGLGSTIARGPARGSGTAIGAILGGALGAGIGGNSLNCDDRNYVYNTYYDGFERGIPRRTYRWRNPRSGNYGTFYVRDYYNGPYGRRCANYTQTIWINGRPVPAEGYACRQPDGNWVIMN